MMLVGIVLPGGNEGSHAPATRRAAIARSGSGFRYLPFLFSRPGDGEATLSVTGGTALAPDDRVATLPLATLPRLPTANAPGLEFSSRPAVTASDIARINSLHYRTRNRSYIAEPVVGCQIRNQSFVVAPSTD